MAQKRIARELAALERARAEGKPYACGLAVDSQDLFRWRCTYTCPQYYVFRGEQRRSPYAGYVIQFQILFPTDYPFKPLSLLAERAFNFFHPLVACSGSSSQSQGVPMGSCSAIVHGVYFLDPDLWSAGHTVLKVLEEGLQPMWTDGDCWVAASAETAQTCVACPQHFFNDPRCRKFERDPVGRDPPVFPQALPCFGGDIRPFIVQHVRGEDAKAAKAARSEKIRENAATKLAEVICPADETSFEIILVTIVAKEEEEVRIQVFPSFPVSQLPTALSQATGLPENRIGRLIFRGKSLCDGTLKDYGLLEPCRVYHCIRKPPCHPFALSGYNPVAAHLLLTDVQKFEHLARQSWSAQRAPHIAQLVCQFSFSIMRPPFPFVPLTRAPLPSLPLESLSSIIKKFITNPHQLHVISGLAMAAVRALACNSLTIYRQTLQRRVLGWAGVLRLAGQYGPMALPPPGCRDYDSFLEHVQKKYS